jgi:hypothetical protein
MTSLSLSRIYESAVPRGDGTATTSVPRKGNPLQRNGWGGERPRERRAFQRTHHIELDPDSQSTGGARRVGTRWHPGTPSVSHLEQGEEVGGHIGVGWQPEKPQRTRVETNVGVGGDVGNACCC